jgi:hypothetical protein
MAFNKINGITCRCRFIAPTAYLSALRGIHDIPPYVKNSIMGILTTWSGRLFYCTCQEKAVSTLLANANGLHCYSYVIRVVKCE